MNKETYTQCLLKKDNSYQISWIPTKYAKCDKVLELKTGGKWENGWTVEKTMTTQSSDIVESNSREYRTHRKVTDI